jgi:hypothetical protein
MDCPGEKKGLFYTRLCARLRQISIGKNPECLTFASWQNSGNRLQKHSR